MFFEKKLDQSNNIFLCVTIGYLIGCLLFSITSLNFIFNSPRGATIEVHALYAVVLIILGLPCYIFYLIHFERAKSNHTTIGHIVFNSFVFSNITAIIINIIFWLIATYKQWGLVSLSHFVKDAQKTILLSFLIYNGLSISSTACILYLCGKNKNGQ